MIRSRLGRLAALLVVTLGFVIPTAYASAPATGPVGLLEQAKMAQIEKEGPPAIDAIFIVEGFDNINFGGRRIVDLHGPTGCTASVSDRDYAVRFLGYNDNQLSSMQVRTSGCVILLFDGPDFTGNSVQFQSCPNLGSCSGENIWKRANSFIVT